jgi:hypothetical protein
LLSRNVGLNQGCDDGWRRTEIMQVENLVGSNAEHPGRVGDVSHQDVFTDAGLDQFDHFGERRGHLQRRGDHSHFERIRVRLGRREGHVASL